MRKSYKEVKLQDSRCIKVYTVDILEGKIMFMLLAGGLLIIIIAVVIAVVAAVASSHDSGKGDPMD